MFIDSIRFIMKNPQIAGKIITPVILSAFLALGVTAQNAPNLIYIISDQLRLDALSCMGNKIISTPNLDRLAAEGVIFTRAYSQCPVCVPSRSCMLTGNSLCNTGIWGNNYAYEADKNSILTGNEPIFSTDTYDEVLAKNGYDCEYFGKWHSPERKAYVYSNRPVGCAGIGSVPELGVGLKLIYTNWWKSELNVSSAPNFQTGALIDSGHDLYYMPDPIDARRIDPSSISTADYQNFGELLIDDAHTPSTMDCKNTIAAIEKDKDKKFSIHCSFGPPHPPFVVAKPYFGSLKESDMPVPANFFVNDAGSPYYDANMKDSPYFNSGAGNAKSTWVQSVPGIQNFQARYYEMVKEIDDKLGEILNKLDQLGLTNNTMIVFCADHGEMLGSHGMYSKNIFYDESVRVPLIIRYPEKIGAGKRVTTPVSLIDIRPTIEDYMGLPAYNCDGKTLRPFIEGTSDKSKPYYTVSEWNSTSVPGFMIRTEQYKLMFGQTTAATSVDALYDMKTDSLEQINILEKNTVSTTEKNTAESMKILLLQWLKKVNSPYYDEVKARPVSKLNSTYVAYRNDAAKIKIAGITAMNNLPAGISYRVLSGSILELTVSSNATLGVVTLKSTVSGVAKDLLFEIKPEFESIVPASGVIVAQCTGSLAVTGARQLTARVEPWDVTNKTVTWKTSDASVATVNSTGLVSAVAAGTATITATTQDGSKTGTYILTVGVNVPVSGITVTPDLATLNAGSTRQLTTTITPWDVTNKTVNWNTSDASVATVNSTGLVSAVAAGTATITATTQDGAKTATSIIAVITSTGNKYLDDCDALSGWNSTPILSSTDNQQGTGCLNFTGTSSAEFSKVFTTPFNSGATAENGQVKLWYWVSLSELGTRLVRIEIGSAGKADVDEYQWSMTGLTDGWNQITLDISKASKTGTPDLTAINWFRIYSSGKTPDVNVTTRVDAIQVGSNLVSAINSINKDEKSVHIYPNPLTKSTLSIDMAGFQNIRNVQVKIVNLLGQTVYQKSLYNTTHLEIDTSGILKKSIYFVSVEGRQTIVTRKLIVQ